MSHVLWTLGDWRSKSDAQIASGFGKNARAHRLRLVNSSPARITGS
jgi:hypothetical protein